MRCVLQVPDTLPHPVRRLEAHALSRALSEKCQRSCPHGAQSVAAAPSVSVPDACRLWRCPIS